MGDLTLDEALALPSICAELLGHRSQAAADNQPHMMGATRASELVPDHILVEFAQPNPDGAKGPLTGIAVAIGCMYFTDICGELLGYRLLSEAQS